METRIKKKSSIVEIVITVLAAVISVGMMFYAVWHFGLKEAWPELVLNLFYIACIVMILLFFFNRLKPHQFNYGCALFVGITVLLRDILFAPHLAYYPIHLGCLTLSVALLIIITYFYARKDWENLSKSNIWMIYAIDTLIAMLYNIDILLEPSDEFTTYMLTEIWIRPAITYAMVACFVKETKQDNINEQSI